MDALSVIGSIASILGGVFSWWQYTKAKTAAQEAKEAKDSVFNRQQISELERVLSSARDAENVLISRSSKRLTNQGKSLLGEYTKIQKLLSDLNEVYDSFTTKDYSNPMAYSKKHLTNLAKTYNDSNSNIQKDALEMLEDVRSIIAILKKEKSRKEFK